MNPIRAEVASVYGKKRADKMMGWLGKTGEFLFGSPEKKEQYYSDPQMQLLQQVLGMAGGLGADPNYQAGSRYLQELLSGDPGAMERFSAPYISEFEQKTVPGLAERYAGMGAGSQSSSGFQQSLGQAGAGLQEQLAAMREQLKFGALGQALGYAQAPGQQMGLLGQLGLGRSPYEYRPAKMGFIPMISGKIAEGLGKAGGMAAGAAMFG